ncbi:Uncharacterised protein [Cedecea davisae]|nr:Uncharacterised protein [Cedecea davisae]
MENQNLKITNWSSYNEALINCVFANFWLDDKSIKAWY